MCKILPSIETTSAKDVGVTMTFPFDVPIPFTVSCFRVKSKYEQLFDGSLPMEFAVIARNKASSIEDRKSGTHCNKRIEIESNQSLSNSFISTKLLLTATAADKLLGPSLSLKCCPAECCVMS